jgi:hypothetical protein
MPFLMRYDRLVYYNFHPLETNKAWHGVVIPIKADNYKAARLAYARLVLGTRCRSLSKFFDKQYIKCVTVSEIENKHTGLYHFLQVNTKAKAAKTLRPALRPQCRRIAAQPATSSRNSYTDFVFTVEL